MTLDEICRCTDIADLHAALKEERANTPVIDYLSCPNCGEPRTFGEPCNLTCRRELLEKQARQWLRQNHVDSTQDTPQKVTRFLADLVEARRKANVLQPRQPTWV